MEAKEYLQQIELIDAKIKGIEGNIKKIRAELERLGDISINSSWPDGQPRGNKITDPTANKAIDLEEKYRKKHDILVNQLRHYEYDQIEERARLWSKRMEVINTIAQVPDSTAHRLLTLRYIELKRWEAIAVDMGYTYQWVAGGLHSQALLMVSDILKNISE